MTLGQRIRERRQAMGLSQRQLCGEVITRNMLSQIENGTARPSMDTLGYLARRLERPISYFLEEDGQASPNAREMARARQCFQAGDYAGCRASLQAYQGPDSVFDWEKSLLLALTLMELAKQAREEGREPYALDLLEQAGRVGAESPYFQPAWERQRRLLAFQGHTLEPDDRELLQRGKKALEMGEFHRAGVYLDGAENRERAEWNFLRGQAYLGEKNYLPAAQCLEQAWQAYPLPVAQGLETCFRELGDYRQAYLWACRQREILP